ncbi:MAG: hypothetical protein WD077_12635 [Bacteroidia bacterium]
MKLTKKLLTFLVVLTAVAVYTTSCKKEEGCTDQSAVNYNEEAEDDDGSCIYDSGSDNVMVTQNITGEETWTSDNVYQLGGRITVESGATLTIEAGTIIKGEAGTGSNATALLVARGATLMAEGRADAPIIFTSVADEIMPSDIASGDFRSPNLDPDINGLWGGVIILGNARISASNSSGDVSEVQIEGIPTSDPNGLYGGADDADNSGVIKYISIRHGGANIGAGNEINGLTMGGVGTGTVIEHIEVVANQDDGFEWFGGSVDVSNIVTWNAGDDGLDTDQSWSGTVDNWFVITAGDHCMELDGPEGTYEASHTMQNGTIIASSGSAESNTLINMDANTGVNLTNIAILNVVPGQIINRVECDGIPGGCPFTNVQVQVPSGSTLEDILDGATAPAGITSAASPTTGADNSALGWTWAAQAGAL